MMLKSPTLISGFPKLGDHILKGESKGQGVCQV